VATNFPTSLDNTDSQKVVDGTNVIVAALPNNLLDMIKALQAKVGVNASVLHRLLHAEELCEGVGGSGRCCLWWY